jgi:predicted nucleic acid-binding protein
VSVVVDTSLFIKWFVVESDSVSAVRLLGGWRTAGVPRIAPAVARAEFANFLLQRLAAGKVTIVEAYDYQAELRRFVDLAEMTPALSNRALSLAHRFGSRSVDDFYFLALAEELECELWTADERLWRTVSGDFPFVMWLGSLPQVAEPEAQ